MIHASPSKIAARLAQALLAVVSLARAGAATGEAEFFESRIRPVLVERCYKCHSAESDKLKGGLRVDTREGLLKGGESGKPAVTPGDPGHSLLIEAIRYMNDDLQMPPKERLTAAQVEDFVTWVRQGAIDPRIPIAAPVARTKPDASKHWAFQPVRNPAPPAVHNQRWPKTPIDRFILATLETKGITPSPPADRRTLIRRATYDLTGLPPAATEVEDFVNDRSRDAFAKVVDRLLSSPRYGERWGRHWLDVARYADTKGYVYSDREESRFVQSAAYRDWVIKSFNDDLPYDRFLRLQLAADELATPAERGDLAALGYLTLGRRFLGVVHDIIDDRIDVVMRGTQALTVGCARCHDHKFDPIPTKDYYSLYGVFNGCYEQTVPLDLHPQETEEYAKFYKEFNARTNKLETTFQAKRAAMTDRLRAKVAEYFEAVVDADKLPTEEFYEIRGPDDLNPTIARQWQAYLFQTGKSFHPVFAPWTALAALPRDEFAKRAP
ncbi:MAG TPA: DUF1549 domain-containing protein, partial [Verrucomicrobiae bacterium]|nr:DUF1549 domain-containing protein [Verrucomicrobiae bacterium]